MITAGATELYHGHGEAAPQYVNAVCKQVGVAGLQQHFLNVEGWISYHFYMSWNILLLLFSII